MKNHIPCPVIFLFVLLPSCEEVIEFPLKDAPPAVVIEGTVTTMPGPYRVIMSHTTGYYNPGPVEYLSQALVFVRDSQGRYWYFKETKQGIYENNNFLGTPGLSYSLQIEWNDQVYTATSTMQFPVPIDSLNAEYFPGTRFASPGYIIIIYFTDPPGKGNYYRIKLRRGNKTSTVIYTVDDQLTDGNQIPFYLFGPSYRPGDTAIVELQSIDKGVYEYMLTLSTVTAASQSGSTIAPANPNTNLSGGALGYFGALAVSRDTLIIE